MISWLKLSIKRRIEILGEASYRTGLPNSPIEKDWWVTIALKAIFTTQYKDHIVFKGGTSLSKAWGVIERFSEDIDLAIDRKILGFGDAMSKTQVSKLRKKSAIFVAEKFIYELQKSLLEMGIPAQEFQLSLAPASQNDTDPQTIFLDYSSVVSPNDYLASRVKIEIGSRSLIEPASPREINAIIDQLFIGAPFAEAPFPVFAVDPQRTFIEKIFLLHEMFQQPEDKWKHERYSRHLYDLYRLMNTKHGKDALDNKELYASIIDHRKILTPVRGIDYDLHKRHTIDFVPRENVLNVWSKDFEIMKREMIYGESPNFPELIEWMKLLRARIRANN